MRIESKKSPHQTSTQQPAQGREYRAVPPDELKRQLGLNLIEAARGHAGYQLSGEPNVSLFRDRR